MTSARACCRCSLQQSCRGLSWYSRRAAPSSDASRRCGWLSQSSLPKTASHEPTARVTAGKKNPKRSLPNASVGTKQDVLPQLHPRQSTPGLAPVCSNILWPAQELGTGGRREVGRDAGSSHAFPLLPTKTPARSYSAHALCLVFR